MEEMMKKILLVAVLGLFLLLSSLAPVFAQEAALKVGVVDLYKAIQESNQGKKAKADLESMVKSKQEALESKGRAIEKLRTDLEKQGDALSETAKKNKADEYERLTREYQRNMADSQNEIRKKESELLGRVVKQIGDIVTAIAQEEKYSLVLERANGVVLFVDASIDITDKVISQLDSAKPKKKK
jgi:outer membrane protein